MQKITATIAGLAIILAGCSPSGTDAAKPGEPVDQAEEILSSAEVMANSTADDWRQFDQDNLLYITLDRGVVIVALSKQLAQNHVAQIKALARENFYDGLSFYRVIDGFVAQGGDALEQREIKSAAQTVAAEFDQPLTGDIVFTPMQDVDGYAAKAGFIDTLPAAIDEAGENVWHLHCAGAMAMARSNEKDSAGTEFYITLQPQRYLDRNLTVFGRVVQGMEHLQALRRVAPPQLEDDDMGETIVSIRVGSDLPADEQARLEVMRSERDAFQQYVAARRNRPEDFFYYTPDHIDVCDLPIPVRDIAAAAEE